MRTGELTFKGSRFTAHDCKDIRHLVLQNIDLEQTSLNKLYELMPNLKKITFNQCDNLNLNDMFGSPNLNTALQRLFTLEEIDLSSCKVSEVLQKVLLLSGQLKKLGLNRCSPAKEMSIKISAYYSQKKDNEEKETQSMVHLDREEIVKNVGLSLKELELSQSHLSIESINTMLSMLPGLETLHMHDYQYSQGFFSLEPRSLLNLKEIDLSKCPKMIGWNLQKLLEAAPNLKQLNLRHWKKVYIAPNLLDNLEEISLSCTDGIEMIINNAPKLKKIIFRNLLDNWDPVLVEQIRKSHPHIDIEIFSDNKSSSSRKKASLAAPQLEPIHEPNALKTYNLRPRMISHSTIREKMPI